MNERRKHKYWKNVMIISFILSLFCCPARTFAEKAEFSGSRICAASIDSSDLENYIDGGRKGLDFVIRKIRPDWLSVDISMSEHDVIVTLKYDFASYQEYRNRTRQMQMHEPLGGYNEEMGVFAEYGDAPGMFAFLKEALEQGGYLKEKEFGSLFRPEKDQLLIGEHTYDADTEVRIGNHSQYHRSVRKMTVHTQTKKDRSYSRNIEVVFSDNGQTERDIQAVRSMLEEKDAEYRERSDSDAKTFIIKFDADSLEELAEKTSSILEIPVAVSEYQKALPSRKIGVVYTETFDISDVLEEEGEFFYTFDVPEYFRELTSDLQSVQIQDGVVISEDVRGVVQFEFEKTFQFDYVLVETDISGVKINRKIVFAAPSEIVQHYHENIKGQLEDQLKRGIELRIYDDNGMRFYELTYSGWLPKDIRKFMENVTQKESDFAYNRCIIPGTSGQVKETFDLSSMLKGYAFPEKALLHYILPKWSKLSRNTKAELEDGEAVFRLNEGKNRIELEFVCFNPYVCAALFGSGCMFVIGTVIMIRRIRRKKEYKKSERIRT